MNNIVEVYNNRVVIDCPVVLREPSIKRGTLCDVIVVDDKGLNREMTACISNGDGCFYELGNCDSKLANAICGEVHEGYELHNVQHQAYKVRGRRIVIKSMDKFTIRHLRRIGHRENPLHEISIMQMMGPDTPNVSGLIDTVEDDTRVYVIMKHLGRELFDFAGKISEKKIQHCFRQIVRGVQTLQSYSLCHRDISLENILISDTGICTIIDFGLALLVPRIKQKAIDDVLSLFQGNGRGNHNNGVERHRSDSSGGLTDDEVNSDLSSLAEYMEEDEDVDVESKDEGDKKHDDTRGEQYVPVLLLPQGNCGKENYVAPEIMANKDPFDGMVVDNWSLGVLLFMLFTGRPPFVRACPSDQYFRSMQRHRLADILQQWGVAGDISPEATDLLEKMLKSVDPRSRFSCEDILAHPWMAHTIV